MLTTPLPCPLCGGPATTHPAAWGGERSIVTCGPCCLTLGGARCESLNSIVERWNTRPAPQTKGPA